VENSNSIARLALVIVNLLSLVSISPTANFSVAKITATVERAPLWASVNATLAFTVQTVRSLSKITASSLNGGQKRAGVLNSLTAKQLPSPLLRLVNKPQ